MKSKTSWRTCGLGAIVFQRRTYGVCWATFALASVAVVSPPLKTGACVLDAQQATLLTLSLQREAMLGK